MKQILSWALVALGAAAALSEGALGCNQALMESYDLEGQPELVSDSNVFCPGVSENCCGYSSQLAIYKKWVVRNEEGRIRGFYDKFSRVFQLIFAQFAVIEKMAGKIASVTASIPGSNCHAYANVILRHKISEMSETVLAHVRRTFEFLLQSRKGLYCTLCDAESHPFFNADTKTFAVDFGFCSKLVENTLNFLLFRFKFFVKASRLYSQFLMNCDLSGRYRPDLVVSNEIKFFRKDAILANLETCRKGVSRHGAMTACNGLCRSFNPVHFSPTFESELDRLFALEGFLRRRVKLIQVRHQRMLAQQSEDDLSPKRVLEDTHATAEGENEVNSFNREFKTVMALHHTYQFKYDTSIKYHTSFDESLFVPGVERVYDLVGFKPEVHQRGIDFFSAGDVVIDRNTAMRAFELLNPETKGKFDFDSYLKK